MKIKKIISLIIVLAISITGYLVSNNITYATAENISTTKLWDLSGNAELTKDTDYTKLSFDTDTYTEFKNTLDFDSLTMVLKFTDYTTFKDFGFEFTSEAPESSDDDEVTNTLYFAYDGTNFTAKLNTKDAVNLTSASPAISITDMLTIKQEDGTITVNGQEIGHIEKVGQYTADLKITNDGDNSAAFLLTSINNQKMKLNDNLYVITDEDGYTDALPSIVINTDILKPNYYIPLGLIYTLDFDGCDVLSSSVTTELKYKKSTDTEDAYIIAKNNKFVGITAGTYDLLFTAVDDNDQKTEIPKQVTVKADDSPPVLSAEFDATDYLTKVENAVYQEGTEHTTKEYLYMGSTEYYYVPDFDGLFTDYVTSYSDMKFDMTYNTPSTSGKKLTNVSASSLKIALSEEGTYSFKILAIDQKGNRSEDYSQLFSFKIFNTQGPQVTAPTSNDSGYQDTSYTSNSFTVKGINTTTVYSLKFYDGTNWVDTEEELTTVTFIPEKIGKYKIICTVTDNRLKTVSEETTIEINDTTTFIKGDTDWLKNNILSIIFLCTGTLSLIGIIVLLLIKPKEETVETVEKDTTKKIVKKDKQKK